jgi:hypothetical protein
MNPKDARMAVAAYTNRTSKNHHVNPNEGRSKFGQQRHNFNKATRLLMEQVENRLQKEANAGRKK